MSYESKSSLVPPIIPKHIDTNRTRIMKKQLASKVKKLENTSKTILTRYKVLSARL